MGNPLLLSSCMVKWAQHQMIRLAVLKKHLQHAQEQMKKFSDLHRRDMVFDIGD